jgi:hypothetical protein
MQQVPECPQVTQLRIQNVHSYPLAIRVEPWGEELSLLPNETYAIVARGPEGDFLEVELGESRVIVYGWPGSVVSIFHEHKLLRACQIPVPSTP